MYEYARNKNSLNRSESIKAVYDLLNRVFIISRKDLSR